MTVAIHHIRYQFAFGSADTVDLCLEFLKMSASQPLLPPQLSHSPCSELIHHTSLFYLLSISLVNHAQVPPMQLRVSNSAFGFVAFLVSTETSPAIAAE